LESSYVGSKMWRLHSNEGGYFSLLDYDTVYSGRYMRTFWRYMFPAASLQKTDAVCSSGASVLAYLHTYRQHLRVGH